MNSGFRDQLSRFVRECDHALADIATLTRLLPESNRWNDSQSFAIGALYTACLRTSGSALVLVDNGQIWDADILMRSVTEGSLKITYMLCNPELFDERFAEFSEALFDIEGIKQHRKAEILLETLEDPEADQWRPIREVLLPEGLLSDISEKYPRAERRAIETRWGFTGLVGQLIKEDLPAAEMFAMLPHGYSMASHHLHADYSGVCSALERDTREEIKRDAVYAAHGARIVSDIFWLAYARLHSGYRFLELDTDLLKQFVEKY